MKDELLFNFIITFIVTIAFVAPSLAVAAKDKDKDCDKNLWAWILVCNIVLASNVLLAFLALFDCFQVMFYFLQGLLGLFILVWTIIGLVWATRSGIKEQCGKLYNVTLGDSIALISLMGCSFCVIVCGFGIILYLMKDFQM
ncbi:hypothetical protein M0811_13379 [Anaeramoeba ignava]|uniref:Uncharacterized protein n=1 Tax=Anaeramoeba ignava TaxID=1746090 RepID=A0A9Q0R4C5_ANAIG|nr:hypothetical protein M0811_13379 [Anaeramoeba ignava]